MADNKVLFRAGTWEQYSNLLQKDPNAMYWISDRLQVWKGDKLYGTGAAATAEFAGLMSAEDKQAFDALIASGGGASYTLELQASAEEGAVATYKLKRTVGGTSSYVGDPINIPADRVLSSGELKYVSAADSPYPGAAVGDPYLDLVLNDATSSHVYIPVKGLVSTMTAGKGIGIVSNIVSIELDAANANGLKLTDAGLGLDLATETSPGAMSAEDKKSLNALSAKYLQRNYEVEDSTTPPPVVKYDDGEIRIMFVSGTNWVSQQVGAGGNPDRYYTNFKAYAPEGATQFREYSDAKNYVIPAETPMETFDGNASAGMDVYGRYYTNVWLPVAKHNADDSWTYFGDGSSTDKYIGWYYCVEWYDKEGNPLAADTIRINLSNENCHSHRLPYYMSEYATKQELEVVSEAIEWGAIDDASTE